jgi:PHD/YefM family antitoxin component YafN of YafNO toxin-antitoxin module
LIKSEDDDGLIEETLHLISSSKNRKHLMSAIKNEGKGKSVTFKSKTEMKKFFIKL